MRLCKVGTLLEPGLLSDEDRATLEREADATTATVPATLLAQGLTKDPGVPGSVGPTAVKDHRGHRCACARAKG